MPEGTPTGVSADADAAGGGGRGADGADGAAGGGGRHGADEHSPPSEGCPRRGRGGSVDGRSERSGAADGGAKGAYVGRHFLAPAPAPRRPRIVVGLGNPGPEYAHTRHNAGFMALDALAADLGVSYWKVASNALVGEVSFRGEKIVLVKPQAFMNLSGGPVKGLCARYGLAAEDLLVIHDELDLPEGTIRLKCGGGHAGHNGLRSLHYSVGAEYARLRIGIGRPAGRMPAHAYVLQTLRGAALEELEACCTDAASVARSVLEDGLTQAMNKHHRQAAGQGDVAV
ncbi:MAG: aminoacyl-tRNA hydrolase [Coriobacteriales bacterium]|jgi:PTH1 family peptidyl-tRNA hydrolase|nr:aminoacyl-tRNA hydrolase [Coriobacteriales bacterium]